MLNDLLSIERGMAAHGIDLAGRHPDVKDMAKGPAFRVRLSSIGAIADIDLVPDAGGGVLWTLRDGERNGFPGLSAGRQGLLTFDKQRRKTHQQVWDKDKSATSRRDQLLGLISTAPLDPSLVSSEWPGAGYRKRITQRLEALRSLEGDPLTGAVPAAFERFLLALVISPPFIERYLAALKAAVRDRGDEWLEPVRTALLGPAALFIDVPEIEFDRDAGHPWQVGPVSTALSALPQSGSAIAEPTARCAMTGRAGNLHRGNFPQPNLPGLGQTYLFARNKDIPSLTRYGRTADASFPIDSDLVRRLSGAITALTRNDAKGRSWRLIRAETSGKPDLLVISLIEARATDALVDDEDGDRVEGQSAWDELGARLIKLTQGEETDYVPLDDVVILVLRAVDPANRKAIYHRNTRPRDIKQAMERWQAATANVPDWLGFVLPVKGERTPIFRTPRLVKPLSITPLSRVQFTNGGRRRVLVVGVTAADAFGLFLREGEVEKRARKILRLLLQRHGALFSGLAAARTKGTDHLKDFDPKTDLRRDALHSVTWIGALLHQLGRLKEVYMSDAAFHLGQLLSAADVIHVGYCADLRGGDVPPSLIGNSVLTTAGANPKRALAILESRLKPYLAWAKREERLRAKMQSMRVQDPTTPEQKKSNRLSQAIGDGFYTAPRLKTLVDELRQIIPAEAVDDAFKAELLLGYLAGLARAQKKVSDPSADTRGDRPDEQGGGGGE